MTTSGSSNTTHIDADECEFDALIWDAAETGNEDFIKSLFDCFGHLIDLPNPFSDAQTPLFVAALNNHGPIIDLLIAAGSKAIDTPDKFGTTPLCAAVKAGHADVVGRLIKAGSKALAITDAQRGWTPLHWAVELGLVDVITALHDSGATSFEALNTEGLTALGLAAREGFTGVIPSLLKAGSAFDKPDGDGRTALSIAITHDRLEVVELFIRAADGQFGTTTTTTTHQQSLDSPSNIDGQTPLYLAVELGRTRIVNALLNSKQMSIDATTSSGRTALHAAVLTNNLNLVELLTQRGSRALDTADQDGLTPLHVAAELGFAEVAVGLLRLGSRALAAKAGEHGFIPLHFAAMNGHPRLVEVLLTATTSGSAGGEGGVAAIDTLSNHGWTPLHSAACHGHVAVVKALLNSGSKALDVRSKDGHTPFYLACQRGHDVVAGHLLQQGSRALNEIALDRKSPLHAAAENGHATTVQFLLDAGSLAIDQCDEEGRTPLQLAASNGHAKVVAALLVNETGKRTLDALVEKTGVSAVYAASQGGHVDVLELLLRKGSRHLDTAAFNGLTPLHIAASEGLVAVINALIAAGSQALDRETLTSGDDHSANGQTPLELAVSNNHPQAAEALLSKSVLSIDRLNNEGLPPLYFAADKGYAEVIQALLDAGSKAIATKIGDAGWTALHRAASNGHLAAVEQLVRAEGAPIDEPDAELQTALMLAVKQGFSEIVEVIARAGSRAIDTVDIANLMPLHHAARLGHVHVIRVLINKGSKATTMTDDEGNTPICLAAQHGHAGAIEVLSKAAPETIDQKNTEGWTPLNLASAKGHLKAVEALLRAGSQAVAIPNEKGWTPINSAAEQGHSKVIEALLTFDSEAVGNDDALVALGADVDGDHPLDVREVDGWTPLMFAARHGHAQIIDLLIRNGSKSIDTQSNDGWTPMNYAAAYGHEEVLSLLIERGSQSLDTVNDQGATPLHSAAEKGHIGAMKLLLKTGSRSLDTPKKNGMTPFHSAAALGLLDVLKYLVEQGTEAREVANADDESPLHSAAANGHVAVVNYLLQIGSQGLSKRDKRGRSPVHAAVESGQLDVVSVLFDNHIGGAASGFLRATDAEGRTPLYIAVQNGNLEMFGYLLAKEHRVEPRVEHRDVTMLDTPNKNGKTPLHTAAEQGNGPMVRALLEADTKALDMVDHAGFTPLALAVKEGKHQDIATLLINAGTDLSVKPQHAGEQQATLALFCLTKLPALDSCPGIRLLSHYSPDTRRLNFSGLGLSNAEAATLPLINWRSCVHVDFRNNPNLTEIPVSLADLKNSQLTNVWFDTGNWSTFEQHIISDENNPRAIMDYVQLKATGEMVPVNERKLMAVGFAAVGKTTLIRRLKDEAYDHPVSTDGIDMGEIFLQAQRGEAMRIVVWDFAGQPLYRQTHLLFLRNPGLCLLLFKLTDSVEVSVEQLRFWCDTLRSLGSTTSTPARRGTDRAHTSSVILVGTHLDRVDKAKAVADATEVWRQVQAFLPGLQQPVCVSCSNGEEGARSIYKLKERILDTARQMNLMAPACLETVRKAVLPYSNSPIPLLTIDLAHELMIKYAMMNNHDRLTKDAKLRELSLRGLQQLGSGMVIEERGQITHVVVNPQWVALLLATVVTTRHAVMNRGRVSYGMLTSNYWRNNPRFPVETHETLVSILEQLKIMFALNKQVPFSRSKKFFVPSSLPEHTVSPFSALDDIGVGSQISSLHRRFVLNEPNRSIPIGVLPQVIVQLMSSPDAKLIEVWQQGGVFRIRKGLQHTTISVKKVNRTVIELIVQAPPTLASFWIREVSMMIENQLADYHMVFEVHVACPNSEPSSPCYLLLDDLRHCVLNSDVQAHCRDERTNAQGKHSRRVDLLSPDILFTDLKCSQFVHQWEDIELDSMLGKGAFGRVMRGVLTVRSQAPSETPSSSSPAAASSSSTPSSSASSTAQISASLQLETLPVAVKLVEHEHEDDVAQKSSTLDLSTKVRNYREFQQEAFLMSLLSHPNIVRFLGVCLPSNSQNISKEHEKCPGMLMEVVGGGTLLESLSDPLGLRSLIEACNTLELTIGKYHTDCSLNEANPERFPHPEPLLPLEALGNRTLSRFRQLTEEISRHSTPEQRILCARLQNQFAQLEALLVDYHREPSALLKKQFDELVDELLSINQQLIPDMGWPLRLKLAADLVQGIMYIHSLNPPLVHCDFKSPNVFLTRRLDSIDLETLDWSQPLCKIGDFGMSVRLLANSDQKIQKVLEINALWAAPEVTSGQKHGTEADVYSLGMTMWEILARQIPFPNIPLNRVADLVCRGIRPEFPPTDLPAFQQLVDACWKHDLLQRPAAAEVYVELRELSRSLAPALYQELAAVAPATIASAKANRSAEQEARPSKPQLKYTVDGTERLDADSTAEYANKETPKVTCLQTVGEGSLWVGWTTGKVGVVHSSNFASAEPTVVSNCLLADAHDKDITTLCYSEMQQRTVWSGSQDGRISVWAADFETIDQAKIRIFLKTRFTIVSSNWQQEGRSVFASKKLYYFTLRNGLVHAFADMHVGAACWQLDILRPTVTVRALPDGDLAFQEHKKSVVVRPYSIDDGVEEPPALTWQKSIAFLVAVEQAGRSPLASKVLSRLASSSVKYRRDRITAFQATDEATWCLSLSTLVEWLLVESQSGLQAELTLGPARQLTFDWNSIPSSSLRSACGLAWVAPDVLWIGAANKFAFLDLNEQQSDIVQPQQAGADMAAAPEILAVCQRCFRRHEGSCADFIDSLEKLPEPVAARVVPFREAGKNECVSCFSSISLLNGRHSCHICGVSGCGNCILGSGIFKKDRMCGRCRAAQAHTPRAATSAPPAALPAQPAAVTNSNRSFSNVTLHWQTEPEPGLPHHEDAILQITLVKSSVSPSGHEVWAYDGAKLLVWQTPMIADQEQGSLNIEPRFLAEVPCAGLPFLTCLKQVGSQVWAGTRSGTIVAWDIATRATVDMPLPKTAQHCRLGSPAAARATVAISVVPAKKRQLELVAFSAGSEMTLRRFRLSVDHNQQVHSASSTLRQ